MIRVSKFRRPNGYWYVRYWTGAQPLDESARTKSETQAETYRLRREIEINAGIRLMLPARTCLALIPTDLLPANILPFFSRT
jgi:hypothetical protein